MIDHYMVGELPWTAVNLFALSLGDLAVDC